MHLALSADSVIIQCGILFILFLLELILCLHNVVTKKVFLFSVLAGFVDFYLKYICMFTHTPDIFTASDFVLSTKRFFFYMPLEYYWAILQVLSYVVSIIIKKRKRISSFRTNILISLFRVILLVLSLLPLFLNPKVNYINVKECCIALAVYFVISFIIESAIDFIFKRVGNK